MPTQTKFDIQKRIKNKARIIKIRTPSSFICQILHIATPKADFTNPEYINMNKKRKIKKRKIRKQKLKQKVCNPVGWGLLSQFNQCTFTALLLSLVYRFMWLCPVSNRRLDIMTIITKWKERDMFLWLEWFSYTA